MAEDKEDLLRLLQAHGQNFLSSFGVLPQSSSEPMRKKRKIEPTDASDSESQHPQKSENEWTGFSSQEESSEDDDNGEEDGEYFEDDDFRSDAVSNSQAEVVVFSGSSASGQPRMTKAQAKSFMSSKISRLNNGVSKPDPDKDDDDVDGEDIIERNNLKNDALLHKLVHTQILSGSLKPDLNLAPAERRKALEGRVRELAGWAKIGNGEHSVRKEERNKASKEVRMGLERKVEERRVKSLEEAKNLGNYHHTIKHLFQGDSKEKDDRRRRDRGLKVGVGKFSDGVLRLSRSDIASVGQGSNNNGARGGRGSSKGSRKRR